MFIFRFTFVNFLIIVSLLGYIIAKSHIRFVHLLSIYQEKSTHFHSSRLGPPSPQQRRYDHHRSLLCFYFLLSRLRRSNLRSCQRRSRPSARRSIAAQRSCHRPLSESLPDLLHFDNYRQYYFRHIWSSQSCCKCWGCYSLNFFFGFTSCPGSSICSQ